MKQVTLAIAMLVSVTLACGSYVTPTPTVSAEPTKAASYPGPADTATPSPSPTPEAVILTVSTATLLKPVVNLREFPGGVVIASLEEGNVVTVLECLGDWCKVQTVEHLGYVWRGRLSGHEDLGCEAR